ncbi:hypothetical protein E2C01_056730 [Portunus trituberculatus]|uniref:Uncharacterized protein n=1 Tax=Portunus trituberculatus TaxID=210409 RepID=A0A5B7GR54_PORTR|nr:hypothetical protein [Portunus trituberculatus]
MRSHDNNSVTGSIFPYLSLTLSGSEDELCLGVRTITNAVNRLRAALSDQLTACWGTTLPECLRSVLCICLVVVL